MCFSVLAPPNDLAWSFSTPLRVDVGASRFDARARASVPGLCAATVDAVAARLALVRGGSVVAALAALGEYAVAVVVVLG